MNIKIGDKVGIKSKWDGHLRMEVMDIREGEVKLKIEFRPDYEAEWFSKDEVVAILPRFDFFPHNNVPFEKKTWKADINFFIVERAMKELRHEFAKDVFNPLSMHISEVWRIKASKEIKKNGREGLFDYLRAFAEFVIENICDGEELKALLAHNLKHVDGYSIEKFNDELKGGIIYNMENSFKWDSADTFEANGRVKRFSGFWDEFDGIVKEAFVDFINENF